MKRTIDNLKFRASSMGALMTNGRSKGSIGQTAYKEAIKQYNAWVYHRYENIDSKYLKKGNEVEEMSITALTDLTNKLYYKNETRLNNDWATGEPDLGNKKVITESDTIIDIKSAWSLQTFSEVKYFGHNKHYEDQGQTYLSLTGATKFKLAYVLESNTAEYIANQIDRLRWKYSIIDSETPEFIQEAKEVERNHIFDMEMFMRRYPAFQSYWGDEWNFDIPLKDRVHIIEFDRDEERIQAMQERCSELKKWLKTTIK